MKSVDLFEIDLGNRLVHIIKVQRNSVQGRHKHATKDGKNMHKTQAGRAGTKWSVPDERNRLSTGLWKMRKNPYYIPNPEKDNVNEWEAKILPNSIWEERKVHTMKYISWQEFFEISHYKNPGDYSSERVKWSDIAGNRKYRPSQLQSFRYHLIDGTNILDLSKPKDQLMYFFALQCTQGFLKNKADRKQFPRAQFYIQELNAPAEEEYTTNVAFDDAIVHLVKLRETATAEVLSKFAVILNIGTSRMTQSSAYNSIRDFIMGENARGTSKTNVQLFNEVYSQYSKKGGMARFSKMYEIQEMLNCRIISIENMKYIWMDKKGTEMEVLGTSREQVISTLLDDANTHVSQMLTTELERKLMI